MRSIITCLLVVTAAVAMVATSAGATDVQDEMREMREMVLKLQDRIEAQQSQIDEQEGVIREAGLEEERGSSSAMSSFLESTDFSGWVAASYFWNFNNPRKPNNGVNNTYSNPFHPDHNSFQFDEAWFVMDRAPTEESPAGFHFEITYGATATAFSNTNGGSGNLNGNDLWIPSANVSYMTPFGPTVTAGKFGTTVGYEVAGAPSNVNITRGFTYNLFQPISHTGATVSQDFDGGFTTTVGIVNGFGTEQFDTNMAKGFLWQVGWGNDSMTLLFNGVYDNDVAGQGDEQYVLDVVAEMTPADNVLLWANYDYIRTDDVGGVDVKGHGLALGGRVGVTDDLGLGGRFEYGHFDNFAGSNDNGDLYSWTMTTDYALTDNLTWKVEYKYEATDDLADAYPKGNSGKLADDAHYVGTQVYYEF
jgi:hypothetical protein